MRQSHSNLKYHTPKVEPVLAVRVTPQNAEAVAREMGGKVETEAKPSDPTDVATWIVIPTLDGPHRLLVTSTGPVVGREFASGRAVVWGQASDFYAKYEEPRR